MGGVILKTKKPLCAYEYNIYEKKHALGINDLDFPKIYSDKDGIVTLSTKIKEDLNSPFCKLPFCHTLEAEALGGVIDLGNSKFGPRGKQYICSNLEDFLNLDMINYKKGRIFENINAIKSLKSKDEKVLFYISGPFTILNILMDPIIIFKAIRKENQLIDIVFKKIMIELLKFIEELKEAKVDIISYGDPLASFDILGRKTLAQVVEKFTHPFLKEIDFNFDKSLLFHLCPKTTDSLLLTDKALIKEVITEPINYQKACINMIGKEKFIGEMCINNNSFILKNSKIKAIKIN